MISILRFNYSCAASSCNTFTKTFAGIDGAGKRLADEVSITSYVCVCVFESVSQIYSTNVCECVCAVRMRVRVPVLTVYAQAEKGKVWFAFWQFLCANKITSLNQRIIFPLFGFF